MTDATTPPEKTSPNDVLYFRSNPAKPRPLSMADLPDEFQAMSAHLKTKTPEDFRCVGLGSGTHLLKFRSARAADGLSTLRFADPSTNDLPAFLPSHNSQKVRHAKVVYRPLEIEGFEARSLVDHIRAPDEASSAVCAAFALVFGQECLDVLTETLTNPAPEITHLPASEFPVVFGPNPAGGDIQITPVSPAATFMGFKRMISPWFEKQKKNAPPVRRGRWADQAISAQPQNISGAIGGPRKRFLATMPKVMRMDEAALYRYAQGGRFPDWKSDWVEPEVVKLAALIDTDATYSNKAIREGMRARIDRLICGALEFIAEVESATQDFIARNDGDPSAPASAPRPSEVIFRRKWTEISSEDARWALSSHEFHSREAKFIKDALL